MMDCFNSMAPSDEELLGLALDDMPLQADAQEHLTNCSICQQRLARYQHTNSYLLTKLYRSQCPTPTQLNLYGAGLLPADKAMGITYHIAECPLCTRETIEIRNVFAAFEPFPLVEKRSPGSVVKRILATFVPWQPQLVMRGDASAARWPRQYSAGAMNISLHLSRGSSGESILLGLFTSENLDETLEELEGVPVDLYRVSDASQGDGSRARALDEDPALSTQIDDLGNIVFKAVPVGEYIMIVRLPDSELVIDGLLIEH